MNKEDYVSLKVARLLEEKGFNEVCDAGYLIEDKEVCPFLFETCQNKGECYVAGFIAAPSLYEAQKWLREKYNCYVQVTHEAYIPRVNNLVQILFYDPNSIECWSDKSSGQYGDNSEFGTYQEALNFGILEALKRI